MKAAANVKPSTWVMIVLCGFLAWMVIISAVIWFTAKASHVEPQPTKVGWQPPKIEQCDLPLWERIRHQCPDEPAE